MAKKSPTHSLTTRIGVVCDPVIRINASKKHGTPSAVLPHPAIDDEWLDAHVDHSEFESREEMYRCLAVEQIVSRIRSQRELSHDSTPEQVEKAFTTTRIEIHKRETDAIVVEDWLEQNSELGLSVEQAEKAIRALMPGTLVIRRDG